MQIINLGNDYATITGGLIKKGQTGHIEEWELPLIQKLGQKVEIVKEHVAEASKTIKKNKK
jgi:hypothetical protein